MIPIFWKLWKSIVPISLHKQRKEMNYFPTTCASGKYPDPPQWAAKPEGLKKVPQALF